MDSSRKFLKTFFEVADSSSQETGPQEIAAEGVGNIDGFQNIFIQEDITASTSGDDVLEQQHAGMSKPGLGLSSEVGNMGKKGPNIKLEQNKTTPLASSTEIMQQLHSSP